MSKLDLGFPIPTTAGAIAGLVATIPMTLFMLAMHRFLPKWQQYALPPEQITDEMADRADIDDDIDKPQLLGATLVSHFGYGSAMGTMYANLTRKIPLHPVLKGALFGLVVWAGSYLGWLRAADFAVAAPEEPAQRNTLMIIAHLIWGSATGLLTSVLERTLSE